MTLSSNFSKQIQNRNFLSPVGFKFVLNRAPKVAFFGNSANIPRIDLGVANQPTYLKDIPQPGDKIEFEDFNFRFLVDEDLENYMQIQYWIRGLGFPDSLNEIYELQRNNPNLDKQDKSMLSIYSDATLEILTSSSNPNFKIKFKDMFPVSLSTLQFDATSTDVDYLTAEVSFKYTIYNIVNIDDTPR